MKLLVFWFFIVVELRNRKLSISSMDLVVIRPLISLNLSKNTRFCEHTSSFALRRCFILLKKFQK